MYHFRLSVELPNGKHEAACYQVESIMTQPFEPMDVCTDNLTALAMGGKTIQQAERIKADRRALAQQISQQLTTAILKAIETQDTVNGYAKGGNAHE